MKVVLVAILCLAGGMLAGDYAYSRVVAKHLSRRERVLVRDAAGVRDGCGAFTVGRGDTALLMVHGFADSPAVFRNLAESLARQSFTCRAIRLPGFAEPVDRLAESDVNVWVETVGAEIEFLRRSHRRVWLVGHSMGGALAIRLAAAGRVASVSATPDSRRIDGLVLIAPFLEVSRRRSPLLPPRLLYRVLSRAAVFTEMVESVFPLDARDPRVRAVYERDTFIPLTLYRNLFQLLDSVRGSADSIDVPLLMVLSRRDRVVDYKAAERFFAAAAAERKSIVYAEAAGHVIPLDYGWEQVARLMAEFVAGGGDR